ncbi:MAG: hypothetical protein P1U56_05125 [Saprospiraceae bacterium]|nr:hypothetical protein [Saprospiraceae bacterium]
MEEWQLDFEWLQVRHIVKDAMGKKDLPDLQSILYLIGIQELGRWDGEKSFTKEEKQDLMHIAVCTLLEDEGYYIFEGRDQDGWPHWSENKSFDIAGLADQELFLKKKVIRYFQALQELEKDAIK